MIPSVLPHSPQGPGPKHPVWMIGPAEKSPEEATKMLRQAESCGCSAWKREGSGDTLEPLPVPKGTQREMERNFGQGHGVTDKGEWL